MRAFCVLARAFPARQLTLSPVLFVPTPQLDVGWLCAHSLRP